MKIINKLGSEIQVGDKILDFAQGLIFKVNKIEPFPDHINFWGDVIYLYVAGNECNDCGMSVEKNSLHKIIELN